MVHGNDFGCAHSSPPDATNSCGTFLSLRYWRAARLPGVPNEPNINSTFSRSTRSRVRSTASRGLELSSTEMKLTLRQLIPPRSLTISKKAASAFPIAANAAIGPVYGMMLPMRISVSAAPAFWCAAAEADASNANTKNDTETRLLIGIFLNCQPEHAFAGGYPFTARFYS